jgi:hypothetical protein
MTKKPFLCIATYKEFRLQVNSLAHGAQALNIFIAKSISYDNPQQRTFIA